MSMTGRNVGRKGLMPTHCKDLLAVGVWAKLDLPKGVHTSRQVNMCQLNNKTETSQHSTHGRGTTARQKRAKTEDA